MRVTKTQNIIIWGASLVLGVALFLIPISSSATTLTQLQQQQALKQQQAAAAAAAAAAAQKQADAINGQISNLDQQITATESAITATESQIADTQAAIDDLTAKIKSEQDQLDAEKLKLNQVLVSWYMEGDNTSLTYALLSSGTLSDAVTKQQYYDSVKQQIQLETEKINQMKADLEKQKADQDSKMASLKSLKDQKQNYYNTTVSQKSYKNTLLTGTLAQKQSYLDQASKLQAEAHSISDAIYAARQAAGQGNEIVSGGGSGGYPYYNLVQDSQADDWGFLVRECTSYAAWYWNIRLGGSWERGNGPSGTGDAKNWPNLASINGVSVHSSPQVGAIISWYGNSATMPYGHVAIVQGINSDGTIDVSEYNYIYRGGFDTRNNVDPGNPRYGSYSYIY